MQNQFATTNKNSKTFCLKLSRGGNYDSADPGRHCPFSFWYRFLFYGFRAFLILLPIDGFIVGFYVGAQAMHIALDEGFLTTTLSIIVWLGAGTIGAFASYVFLIMGLVLLAQVEQFG